LFIQEEGLATYVQSRIQLSVNQAATLPVSAQLEVGKQRPSIEVNTKEFTAAWRTAYPGRRVSSLFEDKNLCRGTRA
jgi:hypothetical protein